MDFVISQIHCWLYWSAPLCHLFLLYIDWSLEVLNSSEYYSDFYSLPSSDGFHPVHPIPFTYGQASASMPFMCTSPTWWKYHAFLSCFFKRSFRFLTLWRDNVWNCFGGWCGVFLNRWCIVFKERLGLVYLETTLTLITRDYLLSIPWMLFLTHGKSARWPRNTRKPQGSGCEQLSLLWFSFFIMSDFWSCAFQEIPGLEEQTGYIFQGNVEQSQKKTSMTESMTNWDGKWHLCSVFYFFG